MNKRKYWVVNVDSYPQLHSYANPHISATDAPFNEIVEQTQKTKQILGKIRERYSKYLLLGFDQLQEQFQGMFRNVRKRIMQEIIECMKKEIPKGCRIGYANGIITTRLKNSIVGNMDGPVFWKARDAINYAIILRGKSTIAIDFDDIPREGKNAIIKGTGKLCYDIPYLRTVRKDIFE